MRLRWRWQWTPISWPAATISAASAGHRCTCSPARKNVAGARARSTAVRGAAARGRALRLSLFRRLVAKPRWVAGTGLGLAGWALQALALTKAPLTVVQPLLGTSLVFLLGIAASRLGERVTRADALAVGAI